VVAAHDPQRVVRAEHDRVRAVLAVAVELAHERDLVELVVAVRVAHAVQAAHAARIALGHDDVERVEGPAQAVRAADLDVDQLN
jgi:hypothetical protein